MPHTETIDCVQKAKALVAEGSADSLRYASLQLRMGIEWLFYELIPLYRDELPDDITTRWRPQEIIDALLECDPLVDQDGKIAFGSIGPGGEAAPPAFVLETRAPNKRLLRKHYHRLGGCLHAPVDGTQPDLQKCRADLEALIASLEEYKWNQALINLRPLVHIPCECGRTIKRNKHGVEATGAMQCTNPKCRAVYDVKIDGDRVRYSLRHAEFACPYCQVTNCVLVT